MAMGRVDGKVAIVTGAGSGIGRAGAIALAREGASVVATDLVLSVAKETAAMIRREGGEASALSHDVGEESQWDTVIEATRKAFGGLDVLVNNAGISGKGSLADTAPEDWRALMRVNLDGVYFGTRAAIAAMVPDGKERDRFGSIIIISSIGGMRGSPVIGTYCISKAADLQLARNLAVELGPHNVRINCIAPGLIRTDFARALWEDQENLKRRNAQTPLRRIGEPDEIAGAAVLLASQAGSYMTGQTIVIDGGVTIA